MKIQPQPNRLPVFVVAATAVLALAVATNGLEPAGAAAAKTTRMQVIQDEWYTRPSRDRVKPGNVKIEVANFGEDDHDFVVTNSKGHQVAGSGVVSPGDRSTLTVKLSKGRYRLWCTLENHRARGMSALLKVKR